MMPKSSAIAVMWKFHVTEVAVPLDKSFRNPIADPQRLQGAIRLERNREWGSHTRVGTAEVRLDQGRTRWSRPKRARVPVSDRPCALGARMVIPRELQGPIPLAIPGTSGNLVELAKVRLTAARRTEVSCQDTLRVSSLTPRPAGNIWQRTTLGRAGLERPRVKILYWNKIFRESLTGSREWSRAE